MTIPEAGALPRSSPSRWFARASLPSQNVSGAIVEARDIDGNLVASTTTDSSGRYTLHLPDGSYNIGIRVGSLDNFTPLKSVVIVGGGAIQGATEVAGVATLDFEVPRGVRTVSGSVLAEGLGVPSIAVQFVDRETGAVRYQTVTDIAGNFTCNVLPVGGFIVRLDPESIPPSYAAPTPKSLAVTETTVAPASLSFTLPEAIAIPGLIETVAGIAPGMELKPDGSPKRPPRPRSEALDVPPGAVIIVIENGIGEVDRVTVEGDGTYVLNLRDGSYTLEFSNFGDRVVVPPPLRITLDGGLVYIEGEDDAIDELNSLAHEVSATVTGTVTFGGSGILTRVFAKDPSTGGAVASADTDASGLYVLSLADGSYDVLVESIWLPPGVIPPEAVRVAVEVGNDPETPIKEESGTSDDGVVDFALAAATGSLPGTVRDGAGSGIKDVRVRALKGEERVARVFTDAAGAFTLQLPLGTIDISLNPQSLPATLVPPAPVRVEVAVVDGAVAIFGSSGEIASLDFELEERSPNVAGTVSFDFDGDGAVDAGERVGARIVVTAPESETVLLDTASDPATGEYSLILGNGSFQIGIDPKSLPPAAAAPAPVRISVTESEVTVSDGTTADLDEGPAEIDFTLTRRVVTLTGTVTLEGNAASVGLELVDGASLLVVGRSRSDAITGQYRLPLFPGSCELRIDSRTLPPGVAIPNTVPLSVTASGVEVSIADRAGNEIETVNFSLSREVALLTGTVTVSRSGSPVPVEVAVQVRDPQSHNVLLVSRTGQATGAYSLRLLAGSWEIAIDPGSIPPGVQPPLPVKVTASGSTVTGTGVSSNVLNYALKDIRSAGVQVSGRVYDSATGGGLRAELRLYDPRVGSVDQNFLRAIPTETNGTYGLRAPEGTYELAIFPQSIPPSAVASAPSRFAVRELPVSSVIEDNVLYFEGTTANAENDGTINFSIRNTSAGGIAITGVVSFDDGGGARVLGGAQVRVKDSSTSRIVAEMLTDFAAGRSTFRLPLGSYLLEINPGSIPFHLIPPAPVSVLATSGGVTTDNGATVAPDAQGRYVFDLTPASASQALQGTVTQAGQPAQVFVKAIDARDQRFIAGRRTAPDGTYRMQLSPGSYTVLVDEPSLPAGAIPPSPVDATVIASGILEESGTENDGTIDFVLASASQTLSGAVGDEGGLPLGCFVVVDDALTGAFVRGAPTSPSDGTYSMAVPTGTFLVRIDPPSLPPGYMPPVPISILVSSGEDETVDFTVKSSSNCISGTVLTETSGMALPVFVVLEDASTGQFIRGEPTRFEDGSFRVCAGIGSYTLKIEPKSLPSGLVVPAPVGVQIAASGILETNQVGDSNGDDDGIVNFEVIELEDLEATLAQLTGTVTLESGGSSLPLGAFIIVEDANTHQFMSGRPTDPATGDYSLFISSGTYDVLLDARQIPPGLPVPPPVRITVEGTEITQLIQGIPVDSNVLDFVLEDSGNAELSGTVTRDGMGFPCFVAAVDRTNDRRVGGVPTDGTGDWTMKLPEGSFLVFIDPPSLPPSLTPPSGAEVTVSGGFIAESAGTPNDGIVPFALSQAGTTLTGFVRDDAANGLFAHVVAINPNDQRVLGGSNTAPGQDFSLSLPDGTFDIVVDPPSLPFDVAPPIPSRITVSGDEIVLTSAGSGELVSASRLRIAATRRAQGADVTVTVSDSGGNPRAARVRVKDGANNLLFTLDVPPGESGATLKLAQGSFQLSINPGSVPPGFSLPSAVAVSVAGSPPAATPSSVDLVLTDEKVTLTGRVLNSVSGADLQVALELYDGGGTRIRQGISLSPVGGTDHASYSLNLSAGTYELSLRRAAGLTAADVILPRDVAVTISGGTIQNPDSDPGTAGTQVDIAVPRVSGTIAGNVSRSEGGSPVALPGLLMNVRDPVDNRLVNQATTDASGDYAIALPAGFYLLGPDPASLSVVSPESVPPLPVEVIVSNEGDISTTGDDLCTGVGPDEACEGVDFLLGTFDAGSNAVLEGTVTTQRTASSTAVAVASARVHLIDPATGRPRVTATTGADGAYSMVAPGGVWSAVLDPGGVDVGYPTIPAPPVRINVIGTSVSEGDVTGAGNAADDGVVNFNLLGASALVKGKVQTQSGGGVGARLVVSTADVTEMPMDMAYTVTSDPSGNYFLPMGLGSFKLWVAHDSLPAGFLPPAPIVFSVSGSTVSESDTGGSGNAANDGLINPIVKSGGGGVCGRLLDPSGDPFPAFVGILIPSSNPNEPARFVVGGPADPATGNFCFIVGDGSYFVEMDPNSVPPGMQSPGRVNFSVATSGETTTVTYQSGAETIDDGGTTRVVLRAGAAAGVLRGTVRDEAERPVGVNVVVEDASTDMFVRGARTDPATGAYTVSLGNGAYNLFVDPMGLPPGSVPPQSVRVSVSGSTVAETDTNGVDPQGGAPNAENDGVVNFELLAAGATLMGYVRKPDESGDFARVGLFAADSSGEYRIFVSGSTSDPTTGLFELGANAGTYMVDMDPGSIPPGTLAPEGVVISVEVPDSGPATITLPETAVTIVEGGETFLVLGLRESAEGVSGSVTSGGAGLNAFVVAENSSNHQFVGGNPTDPSGYYTIYLPAGTFDISINSFSLPPGILPPRPARVTVVDSVVPDVDFELSVAAVLLEGYVLLADETIDLDDPGIDCSDVASNAHVQGVSCGVDLMIPSQDSNSPPTFLTSVQTDPQTGRFVLPLSDGTFQVNIYGGSLPPGMLPPPPLTVSVTGSSMTLNGEYASCSDDPSKRIIFVSAGAATLRGFVKIGSGAEAKGVGCFIEVIDPTEGTFFIGTPTNPQDGSFAVTLGDRSYEVRVATPSVPPGMIAPAPVRVSAPEGVISLQTVDGVTYEGSVLTITLSPASRTVSGRVTDQAGDGFSVNVMAFDTGDCMRGQAFSALDGTYTLYLSPGNYEIHLDSSGIPAGYMAPPNETVNVLESSATGVDFVLADASATISGDVFFVSGESEVGVPAFIQVINATTDEFVTGSPAQPDGSGNYSYSVGLGAGSFRIGVSPFSIPPGYIAPTPVAVTIALNEVTGNPIYSEAAHGADADLTDGVIDFELGGAAAILDGRLASQDGQGIPGHVVVEVAGGSHQMVFDAQTDSNGSFTLSFGEGSYDVIVDPYGLPPGFMPPAAKTAVVAGSSITIDGTVVSGTYEIVVDRSAVSLTGHVYRDGGVPVPGAAVNLIEPSTGRFVNGSGTGPNGDYTLALTDGSFLVKVEPWSLPMGYSPPTPVAISVSGSTISSGGSPIAALDLTLSQAVATVQVDAQDSFGMRMSVQIDVSDQSGETVITNGQVSGGPVTFSLPAGSFLVQVPNFSLPPNTVAPPPVSLAVEEDGNTVDSSGFPGDGIIILVLQAGASQVSGAVLLAGATPMPLAGVRVVAIDREGSFEVSGAFTKADGSYELSVPVGDYDVLAVDGLPADTVRPSPFQVHVLGEGQVEPSGPIDIMVYPAKGTVSGILSLDGAGAAGWIGIFKQDGMGSWFEVTSTDSGPDGSYSMAVPAGTFAALAEIEDRFPLFIVPLPQTIDIPDQITPTEVVLDFGFLTPGPPPAPPSKVLQGSVTASGMSMEVPVLLLYQEMPMAIFEARDGQYQMALAADQMRTFVVRVFPKALPPGYTAPSPVSIAVSGAGITGAGVVPSGEVFVLDFSLSVSGAVLHGTVTDLSGNPFPNVEVASERVQGAVPGPLMRTDATGFYTLVLEAGEYDVDLRAGLPPGLVRPAISTVVVTDEGGGSYSLTIDGAPSPDGNLSWELIPGRARVTGQLTLNDAPTNGEIIATDASGEVSWAEATNGVYDIYLPPGDLTLTAEIFTDPPGLVSPAPFQITVPDGASVLEDTHNFSFTAP